MSDKHGILLDTWERKAHFDFFSKFSDPFFGITVNVDFTEGYRRASELNCSYFLFYLYCSLAAANKIEPFRYRIEKGLPVCYNTVHASATINRNNGTFGFSYIPFYDDFFRFLEEAKEEIEDVQKSEGLLPATSSENVIHYTTLPWLSFTQIKHPSNTAFNDSIPKIAFGKYFKENDKLFLPVSVHAHHGLMDGLHVAKFIEKFQYYLDNL